MFEACKYLKSPVLYRAFLLLAGSLFWLQVLSQNLIPNAGFENIFTRLEYQWVQPQGAYYHYESPDSLANYKAPSGRYVNGLCMYNYGENEFLHVKLLQPLEEGNQYQLSLKTVLMNSKAMGYENQRYIGVYFGTEKLNTHIPGDLYFEPQILLELPDSGHFDWFELLGAFQANGGESYMTIGYFPAVQVKEIREMEQEAYMKEIEIRYEATQKEKKEDMSWLYLPPDEQKKYLKQKKKEEKKSKSKSEQKPSELAEPKTNSTTNPFENLRDPMGAFAVRYYFDDFCLVKFSDDGNPQGCEPELVEERIEKGSTIQLRNVFFETDKAVLKEESIVQLKALKDLLLDYPDMEIEIRGYTDNEGEAKYNLDLSMRRAQAVQDWLSENGIVSSRLNAKGFGEADPIETNETRAGRMRNRRVAFTILKL